MRLALIIVLLLSGCGGYAEQEDYGWVEKPKRSVLRTYSSHPYGSIGEHHREYIFGVDGELDSILEGRERSRGYSVYTDFQHARLGIQDEHSYFSHNIVPWDRSLAASVVTHYDMLPDSTLKIYSRTLDSIHNGELSVRTDHWFSAERTSVTRRGREIGKDGYIARGAENIALDTLEGFRYFYTFKDGLLTRATVTYTGKVMQRGPNLGRVMTDTTDTYDYSYGSSGKLTSVFHRAYAGATGMSYAYAVSVMDIVLADSIAPLSRALIKHDISELGPINLLPISYTKEWRADTSFERATFKLQLDARYRILSIRRNDQESQFAYFNDNAERYVKRIFHAPDGEQYGSMRSWQVRKYDARRRVVEIEEYYIDHRDREQLLSRESFEYE